LYFAVWPDGQAGLQDYVERADVITARARVLKLDVDSARSRVLADLRAEGVIADHRLVAEHSVVMDPAYVHITQASMAEHRRVTAILNANGVYPAGRYGRWTYCSIEDNIIEAKGLVAGFESG